MNSVVQKRLHDKFSTNAAQFNTSCASCLQYRIRWTPGITSKEGKDELVDTTTLGAKMEHNINK